MIGYACGNRAKINVPANAICSRTFWPRFVSECWWEAWWSLALHCGGLPAAAYHDLLTRLSDRPGSDFFLSILENYRESLPPSRRDDYISSHCPVNSKKPISIKHTYKPPMTMCPAKHIWGHSEFISTSTCIWTVCCDTALIPQSVLALAWLNLGLQEANATWRLEIQHFSSFFPLSLMAKYKESVNLLIEFTLWTPHSVKRAHFLKD